MHYFQDMERENQPLRHGDFLVDTKTFWQSSNSSRLRDHFGSTIHMLPIMAGLKSVKTSLKGYVLLGLDKNPRKTAIIALYQFLAGLSWMCLNGLSWISGDFLQDYLGFS
jgi:hypothetical protein